ncbi:MAG: B12-binding domain-containing radical SAM protein [Candidatus Copromonas sp.]|nr:B12-binding domain-containing radical SAM protein [Candidatus Copromonas sp.]
MKFLLAAINAKYIHSNPGVYSLRAFAQTKIPGADIEIGEYTINHQMDLILQDIYRRKPDFIGFSCYIWNISYIMEIVRDVKKVLPEAEIWLGGPEVSYDAKKVLTREPDVSGIMRGEGELTFTELVRAYLQREKTSVPDGYTGESFRGQAKEETSGCAENTRMPENAEGENAHSDRLDLSQIPGITYRAANGEIEEHGPQRLLSLDEIPFYYDDMAGFENRIVYYESSRGCPFSCSYCLSSIDKTVRFRSLDLVLPELQFFLDHKVPQVKFVDRTFNCKREHTLGIWRYLVEHDNGITNFHFEVSADIFDEEELELIGKMRPGLIQLEIGVQSTNPDTIREIHRHMDLVKLKRAVDRVYDYRNTHQHLDLIAGLPYENYESFMRSFDDVYRMRPDQLQMGFLKVLKGSYIEEQVAAYDLKYRGIPPYEVLSTKWLPYSDVIRLKGVEDMVEVYYNSGQFPATMKLLEKRFQRPSEIFVNLAEYYEKNGLTGISHSRLARYEILYRFLEEDMREEERDHVTAAKVPETGQQSLADFRDSLMYDLYVRENIKSRPSFASDQSPYKKEVREFFMAEEENPKWLTDYAGFDSRQMAKMAHLEHMEDGTFVLFDYKKRDPLSGNAGAVRFVYKDGEETWQMK